MASSAHGVSQDIFGASFSPDNWGSSIPSEVQSAMQSYFGGSPSQDDWLFSGDTSSSASGGSQIKASPQQGLSTTSSLQSFVDQILSISAANNSWSAQQAADARSWQQEMVRLSQEYNSAEAAKNRDWQKMMSDTAHQREVADLKAAGLNPVLSASGGNGAAVTSGATAAAGSSPSGAHATADTSANAAITGILSAMLSAQTSLEAQRMSAMSNEAIADKYTAMSKYTSELQAQTQLTSANIDDAARRYVAQLQAQTGHYSADTSAAASKVVAAIHAAASRYGTDISAMTSKEINAFNAMVNQSLQQSGFRHDVSLSNLSYQHQFDLKKFFPGNEWEAGASVLAEFGGISGLRSMISDLFSGSRGSSSSAKGFSSRSSYDTFGGKSKSGLPHYGSE